jgi:hypothetical protein
VGPLLALIFWTVGEALVHDVSVVQMTNAWIKDLARELQRMSAII